MRTPLCLALISLALAATGCKKAPPPDSTATSATPAQATTTSPPAKADTAPPALDDATKKKLVELFDKNKATMKKCDPLKNDLHRSIEAKDFKAVPAKSVAYNGCRRAWVSGLMPQISKLGSITEEQAVDQMMVWDLNRK